MGTLEGGARVVKLLVFFFNFLFFVSIQNMYWNQIDLISENWSSYPVPHSRYRLVVMDPKLPIHLLRFANHKNCKTTCPKEENEICGIVQYILHLLKARTMMNNMFLSHSYILVFPPKSLFSITLILICITLSLVTLLGNHFSFHSNIPCLCGGYFLGFFGFCLDLKRKFSYKRTIKPLPHQTYCGIFIKSCSAWGLPGPLLLPKELQSKTIKINKQA